ncbi:oligosaccharide flippase family protein [Radicibacter daui]|uniref:oligosaccharide flippase family protein n=1 Tax=Radicibacter daui TaxID=3064829 RepID=UPI00404702D3
MKPETEQPLSVGRSLRWSYVSTGLGAVLQLVFAALLARLLTPDDYGVIAVGAGAIKFIQYLVGAGAVAVIIRKSDFDPTRDAAILFASGVLMSAGVAAVTAVLIFVAGGLFGAASDPQVRLALAMLCFGGPLSALGQVSTGILSRNMAFRRLGLQNVGALVLSQLLVALPAAWYGLGYWSLVLAYLAQTALTALFAFLAAPHPLLSRQLLSPRARGMLRLAGSFSMIRIMDSAGLHLLPVVLVHLAGIQAAGLWDRSFALAFLPMDLVVIGLGRVLFPAYGTWGRDRERLQQAWLAIIAVAALFMGTLTAGIATLAQPLALLVLGPVWTASGPVMSAVALWALMRGLSVFAGGLIEATGRLHIRVIHQGCYLVALSATLWFFDPQGAAAFALCLFAVDLFFQSVLLVLAAREIGLGARTVASVLLPGAGGALVVAGSCYGGLSLLRSAGVEGWLLLILPSLIGGFAFTVALFLNPSSRLRRSVGQYFFGGFLGWPLQGEGWRAGAMKYLIRT